MAVMCDAAYPAGTVTGAEEAFQGSVEKLERDRFPSRNLGNVTFTVLQQLGFEGIFGTHTP